MLLLESPPTEQPVPVLNLRSEIGFAAIDVSCVVEVRSLSVCLGNKYPLLSAGVS